MSKAKLLLYCTKNKKKLFFDEIEKKYMLGLDSKNDKFNSLNGKIVAECDFEVEEIKNIIIDIPMSISHLEVFTDKLTEEELFKNSCLCRYID